MEETRHSLVSVIRLHNAQPITLTVTSVLPHTLFPLSMTLVRITGLTRQSLVISTVSVFSTLLGKDGRLECCAEALRLHSFG